MLVGRSDRRVSLMDISDPTKPVQLGSDVILPNNPISITISVKGKDTFAYVVSEGNLSIISLNLPKGPTKATKARNLSLGASPNSFTVNQDGSLGYALGSGGRDLFPIDLTSPSTAQLGPALTLPEFLGSSVSFLYRDHVLGVTAKDYPIFMRIQLPISGDVLSVENITLNNGCTSSMISSTISSLSYVAGGTCLSCIYLNHITPPPVFPNPSFIVYKASFSEDITALAPSSFLVEAYVAVGKKLFMIQDNKVIQFFEIPQGARALVSPDTNLLTYISPNTSDQFISSLEMIGNRLTNFPMPWKGPYPCLALVPPLPSSFTGSPPKKEKKPKKGSRGCQRCRKCEG